MGSELTPSNVAVVVSRWFDQRRPKEAFPHRGGRWYRQRKGLTSAYYSILRLYHYEMEQERVFTKLISAIYDYSQRIYIFYILT